MSKQSHWNPEDTQTLDRLELKRTEREKWAAVTQQIKAMADELGNVRADVASLKTHVFYLKWILGVALGIAVAAVKLHG